MSELTAEQLAEARRLVKSAIDAPWTVKPNDDETVVVDGNGMWVAIVGCDHGSAAFIAAARTLVPALLDEIERLRGRLATMQQTRDQSCSCAIADGSAPLVTHHKDCALRVRKRIDPALALSRLATALDSENETAEAIATWLENGPDIASPDAMMDIAAYIRRGDWRRHV